MSMPSKHVIEGGGRDRAQNNLERTIGIIVVVWLNFMVFLGWKLFLHTLGLWCVKDRDRYL